jgi:hypothetical protein
LLAVLRVAPGLLAAVELRRHHAGVSDPKLALWIDFIHAHDIAAQSVPLFAQTDDGKVETFVYGGGAHARPMLRRSSAMRDLVVGTVKACLAAQSEGLLYMMFREGSEAPGVPLYIGRAGRVGRNGGLSQNLRRIETNEANFARWGYNYAYHLGDLSAAVLDHAKGVVPKYRSWVTALFYESPATAPRLRWPVRFWCTEWSSESANIWPEFGPCSLSFIEYLLIGVASALFPHDLLNREGVNAVEVA